MSLPAQILRLPILAYRILLSPVLGTNCRYAPSCSEFALEALATHGVVRGSWLALRRIATCHPWGGHGYDPVPPCRHCADAEPVPSAGSPAGHVRPSGPRAGHVH